MVVWFLVGTVALGAPALKDRKEPAEPPEGRWGVQRCELDGRAMPVSVRSIAFRFTAEGFELEMSGLTISKVRAEFYTLRGVEVMEYRTPPVEAIQAIWKVDGDTMLLCEGRPGDLRPADFTAPKGSGRALWKLKRTDR